jgi:hypothetical protein
MSQPDNMEPDDPRVNPELHLLVQDALQPFFAEGIQKLREIEKLPGAPPLSMVLGETRAKARAARLKVIEDYQKGVRS